MPTELLCTCGHCRFFRPSCDERLNDGKCVRYAPYPKYGQPLEWYFPSVVRENIACGDFDKLDSAEKCQHAQY
jgi:hypothetical protein